MTASILSDGIARHYSGGQNSFQTLTNKQLMDLQSAKKKIVEMSRKDPKKKFYLNVDGEGEVDVSTEFIKDSSGFCYKNGSEIALPEVSNNPEPKEKRKKSPALEKIAGDLGLMNKKQTKKTVETETSKTMATKTAKKPAAKKSAGKSEKVEGKKVEISIKDMRAGIKKGFVYRNLQGVLLTETILAGKARQEHVREVYVSK